MHFDKTRRMSAVTTLNLYYLMALPMSNFGKIVTILKQYGRLKKQP